MAAESDETRCHAITAGGERCKRPAGEDGFCHQHDESDETVEEYGEEAEAGDDGSGETAEARAMSDGGSAEASAETEEGSEDDGSDESESSGGESEGDAAAEESESGGGDESGEGVEGTDSGAGGDGLSGVRDVRETVQTLAPEIIGRKLDAVIEVDGRDDGWLAVVEVVERPAVPDTQDILGRYEIDLADGAVTGYRRIERYRRSDMEADEPRP